MSGISITNISYHPTYFVQENGGSLTVEFDVAVDCSPDPPPGFFTWELAFHDATGATVHTESGSVASSAAHVTASWASPNVPDGGVRPYITVYSECTGSKVVGFCTGITRVPAYRPLYGSATCRG